MISTIIYSVLCYINISVCLCIIRNWEFSSFSTDLWHFVICDMCHVVCDVPCDVVLKSHFDFGVVTFLKWYHKMCQCCFPLICDICDILYMTCDVWCDILYVMCFIPMLMLGWRHFQNGVTQGVQEYFSIICDICYMWCVTCDVTNDNVY